MFCHDIYNGPCNSDGTYATFPQLPCDGNLLTCDEKCMCPLACKTPYDFEMNIALYGIFVYRPGLIHS